MTMIKTARTTIRPFVSSDLNDLQQILGDPVTMTYVEPPYTYEQTKHFLENFCIKRKAALACVHKDNNKLIGYLLFKSLGEADSNGHNDVYELGWIFNRNYWCQGFAYEASKALLDYAFDNLKAHRVSAETINLEQAKPLLEKLGLHCEGRLIEARRSNDGDFCDLYVYGLVKNQED